MPTVAATEAWPAAAADKPWAATPLTRGDADEARRILWQARLARLRTERADEVAKRELRDGDLVMPFFMRTFGEKPAGGRSLWISLHGGGGAPAQVNDQQWENQQRLYEVPEGVYCSPRAPTNTWNLWHEPHIDRLFQRLIEDLVAVEGVDPDRVYILGYSAGGDGVYQLAPRMADHWAAAAMMAGHPNGVSLEPLRNVPFALQVGELDTAYDRARIGAEYGAALQRLHDADPEGYRALVKIHAGKGHWMDRDDAAALPWMARFTRDPVPKRVVWQPTAASPGSCYWLAVPPGEKLDGVTIIARRDAQTVTIESAEGIGRLLVRLDDRMLDCDQPVRIMHGDRVLYDGPVDRSIANLEATLERRGDASLTFSCQVALEFNAGR